MPRFMTGCIICCIVFGGVFNEATSLGSEEAQFNNSIQNLPPDIEMMMASVDFKNFVDNKCTIRIRAKYMLRRGKKVLGFRSNLIKNNIFAEINGELVSPTSRVNFSGDYGEWDLKAANSLLLSNQVTLSINGKKIPVVKKAQIDFGNSTIRVDDHAVVGY